MSSHLPDIIVALITVSASWGAYFYTTRKQKRDLVSTNMRSATEFGQTLAQSAFTSLTAQVTDSVQQQKLWQDERKEFIERTDHLSQQLDSLQAAVTITNQYVYQLLLVLDSHNIPRPPVPPGLKITRPND